MIEHIRQPKGSSVCGQACLAMIAGVTINDACRAIFRNGATNTHQIRSGLRRLGFVVSDERMKRIGRNTILTELCMIKTKGPGRFDYHWVVFNGKYHDPAFDEGIEKEVYEKMLDQVKWKRTSYLEIKVKKNG